MKKQTSNHKRSIKSALIILMLITVGYGGSAGDDSGMTGPVGSIGVTGIDETTLGWDAPTTNADGTPLTVLTGYKICNGNPSRNYSLTEEDGDEI